MLISRLNKTLIFDPECWPQRELLGKICAVAIIIFFLTYKVFHFGDFPGFYSRVKAFYEACPSENFSEIKILMMWFVRLVIWILETGILCVYIFSYLIRIDARSVAKGFMETGFPFIIASVPFFLSLIKYNFDQYIPYGSGFHFFVYVFLMGVLTVGTLVNLIGLVTMRQAFTVMAEARVLITDGIFRFVRHPLYTGHMIITFAMICMRFYWYTVLLYIFFVVGVFIRARYEENKMEQTFPDYAGYKRRTGMFFAKFQRMDA